MSSYENWRQVTVQINISDLWKIFWLQEIFLRMQKNRVNSAFRDELEFAANRGENMPF